MPKLNSTELKHKRMILNWVGKAWPGLKEASKVRIFCTVYDKSVPSKLKIEGEIDHFFNQSNEELDRLEAQILKRASGRLQPSEN